MYESRDPYLEEVERNARQLANSVAELIGVKKEEGRERFQHLSHDARAKYEQARQVARQKGQEIDKLAHDNPWAAVGIAAAVGALLGAVLFRSRRDR